MGTASYVVVGKGNVPSLMSSPHGAGRNHSRSAARKLFTAAGPRRAHGRHRVGALGRVPRRAPRRLQDIDQVMADAADLVEVRHTLRQIVNVKGD